MTDPVREAAQRFLDEECKMELGEGSYDAFDRAKLALRQALQAPTSVERRVCPRMGLCESEGFTECRCNRKQLPQSEEGRGEPSENLPSAGGGGKAKRPETLSEYFDLMPEWPDYRLRRTKRPDGTYEFYIHPQDKSGPTGDFVVSGGSVRDRGWHDLEKAEDATFGQYAGGLLHNLGADLSRTPENSLGGTQQPSASKEKDSSPTPNTDGWEGRTSEREPGLDERVCIPCARKLGFTGTAPRTVFSGCDVCMDYKRTALWRAYQPLPPTPLLEVEE